jgi:Pyruvate/2-oxoacid:ferredoxin oxidoreductase gamma subunit
MSALPNSIPSRRDRRSKSQSDRLARQRQLAQKNQNRFKEERSTSTPVALDYKARVWESGLILGMNVVLIGTALVTLANLLPNQLTQRAKLKEISREESQVAQNLQALQQTYQRSQSPETAQRIAQEQGSLMRADQLKVFQTPQGEQKVQ